MHSCLASVARRSQPCFQDARFRRLGVFMYVLSEVEGIERMQAVVISIGTGIVLVVLAWFFTPALLVR